MGWLEQWDKRNQRIADHQRNHPELGTKMPPYYRSFRARLVAAGLLVSVYIALVLFGYWGCIAALAVVLPLGLVLDRRAERRPSV